MANYLYVESSVTDFASTPNAAALNVTTDLIVRVLVQVTDYSLNGVICSKWNATGNQKGWVLRMDAIGRIQFIHSADGSASGATQSDAPSFTDGDWYWIEVEHNGTSGNVIFRSATEAAGQGSLTVISTHATATSIFTNTSLMHVGLAQAGQPGFIGGIQHMRVWDDTTLVFDADFTDLSVAELEALAFTEDSSNAATVTLAGTTWTYVRPYGPGILGSAELLLMAADGNKGFSPKWADRSGNNHHAQLGSAAGADTNDPTFKANDGTQFITSPIASGNYISVPDSAAVSPTGDFTVEIDMALTDWTPSIGYWLDKIGSGGDRTFRMLIKTGGQFAIDISEDGTNILAFGSTAASGLTDGTRYRIRGEFDITNGSDFVTTWYIDDVLFATITNSDGAIASVFDSSRELGIMGRLEGSAQVEGDFYRFRMWTGLGTSGTLLVDVVGADATEPYATFAERANGATVTISRSSTGLVSTVVDRDMFLFSTDNYVEIPDDNALDFIANANLTAIVVIRVPVVADDTVYLAHKESLTNADNPGYAIGLGGSGNALARQGTGSAALLDALSGPANNVLVAIAARRTTAASEYEVFVDGVGSGSPATDTNADISTSQPFRIGANSQTTAAEFAEGAVLAVALWRSDLTTAEILAAGTLLAAEGSSYGLLLLKVG